MHIMSGSICTLCELIYMLSVYIIQMSWSAIIKIIIISIYNKLISWGKSQQWTQFFFLLNGAIFINYLDIKLYKYN